MKKKAHRLKFVQPTRRQVEQQFNEVLESRVTERLIQEMNKEDALFDRLDWMKNNQLKFKAQEKLKLVEEWRKLGRRVDYFEKEFQDTLEISIFGRIIK